MNDVLTILAWLAGVAYLFAAAVAISRRIDRHYDRQGQP